MVSDAGTESASARALLTDSRLFAIVFTSGTGLLGTQAIPPILPAIAAGLGVSAARIGLVISAFFFTTMLFTPLVGVGADLYGRRPVVLGSLATFGLAGLAAFFADSFRLLLALRAIQGAAFAGTLPLTVALIGDFFEGAAGTTAQGIRSSVHGAVIVVSPTVAGALAGHGWNVPFLLYGGALLAFALVYYALPEATADGDGDGSGEAERAATSDAETTLAPADQAVRASLARFRHELRTYGTHVGGSLRDSNLAVLIAGGFAVFLVRNGVLVLVPLYAVRQFGGGTVLAGLLLSLIGVTRVVASPLSGRLLASTSRRFAFMATMSVVAVSVSLLIVAPSIGWFGGAVAAFGVGMALFNPMLNDAVATGTTTESRAGVVSSMMLFKNAANTAGPAGFTFLAGIAGFDAAFGVAAAVGVGYVALVGAVLDEEIQA